MSKIGKKIAKVYNKGRALVRKAAQSEFGRDVSKAVDKRAEGAAAAVGHGEAYRAARSAVSAEYGGTAKYRKNARKNLKEQAKEKVLSSISGN